MTSRHHEALLNALSLHPSRMKQLPYFLYVNSLVDSILPSLIVDPSTAADAYPAPLPSTLTRNITSITSALLSIPRKANTNTNESNGYAYNIPRKAAHQNQLFHLLTTHAKQLFECRDTRALDMYRVAQLVIRMGATSTDDLEPIHSPRDPRKVAGIAAVLSLLDSSYAEHIVSGSELYELADFIRLFADHRQPCPNIQRALSSDHALDYIFDDSSLDPAHSEAVMHFTDTCLRANVHSAPLYDRALNTFQQHFEKTFDANVREMHYSNMDSRAAELPNYVKLWSQLNDRVVADEGRHATLLSTLVERLSEILVKSGRPLKRMQYACLNLALCSALLKHERAPSMLYHHQWSSSTAELVFEISSLVPPDSNDTAALEQLYDPQTFFDLWGEREFERALKFLERVGARGIVLGEDVATFCVKEVKRERMKSNKVIESQFGIRLLDVLKHSGPVDELAWQIVRASKQRGGKEDWELGSDGLHEEITIDLLACDSVMRSGLRPQQKPRAPGAFSRALQKKASGGPSGNIRVRQIVATGLKNESLLAKAGDGSVLRAYAKYLKKHMPNEKVVFMPPAEVLERVEREGVSVDGNIADVCRALVRFDVTPVRGFWEEIDLDKLDESEAEDVFYAAVCVGDLNPTLYREDRELISRLLARSGGEGRKWEMGLALLGKGDASLLAKLASPPELDLLSDFLSKMGFAHERDVRGVDILSEMLGIAFVYIGGEELALAKGGHVISGGARARIRACEKQGWAVCTVQEWEMVERLGCRRTDERKKARFREKFYLFLKDKLSEQGGVWMINMVPWIVPFSRMDFDHDTHTQ